MTQQHKVLRTLKTKEGVVTDKEPWDLISNWLAAASQSELNDPDGAALATANSEGKPSVRMVLVRYVGREGAYFYTNETSRKGKELHENPLAALLWHWKSLRLQIRMEGCVTEMESRLADHYFASRSRGSQISAWASFQSQEMEGEHDFSTRLTEMTDRFAGSAVPRPPWWKGFVLEPATIEFWQDGDMRRHDRLVYTRQGEQWQKFWLYP